MALNEQITGSVTGKIKFVIDKASWSNLDKFQKKLTSVKKQMTDMNKTINVNAVVKSVERVKNVTVNAENAVARAKVKSIEQVAQAEAKAAKKKAANDTLFKQRVDAFMTVKENQINNEAIRKGYAGSQQHKDNLAALKAARETNFNEFYGNIGQFRANINGVVNGMHTVQRTAAANKITFASLRGELVQLTAAYGAFAVAQNIVQTGFSFEGLNASAKVFAKDDAGVAEHMNFIREQAYRLGVDLQTATKEFTKFSIATKSNLSKKDQRELFVGISEYARVMGVSQSDYERAFRAVQQIASKGQLTI